MPYELPSLNALRAFEAAARHESMKGAGTELYVTPGAVSQHIKTLEDELGVCLFRRHPRGVTLTGAGHALYAEVREGFRTLARAVEAVREHERTRPLTVSLPPSLAMKWLVPRLGRLRAAHPALDVRLDATERLVDFAREDIDLAIRCTPTPPADLDCELLMEEDAYPVISPALLAQGPPLRTPADLAAHTLLHTSSVPSWAHWAAAHGIEGLPLDRGPVFSNAAMTLQAAVEGQGVAIAYTPLAYADLAEGRLVRPLEQVVRNTFAYYVICPEASLRRPGVRAFRDWVFAEAAQDGFRPPDAASGAPAA